MMKKKLTRAKEIKSLRDRGKTLKEIGDIYRVSATTVSSQLNWLSAYSADRANDIFGLKLTNRAINCLRSAGISTKCQLVDMVKNKPHEALRIPSLGRSTYQEIMEALGMGEIGRDLFDCSTQEDKIKKAVHLLESNGYKGLKKVDK